MALQSIVLAARAAGIAVFDGVFNRLDDADGFAAEAAREPGAGLRRQVADPSRPDRAVPRRLRAERRDEIARAERLVAAATGGAERFEGAMIEAMHVEAARRLLARGRALTGLANCAASWHRRAWPTISTTTSRSG